MPKFLAIVCTVVLPPAFALAQKTITVRGSDAMIVFGQRCANLYGSSHPDVRISVNGGGPERGIEALLSHSTQIAQLPQAMPRVTRERLQAAFGRAPVEVPIAVEAIVVFVNHANPVSALTLAQVRDIYLGKIDNWKQVGGLDQRIQLYSTESAIGGSLFFREVVLNGDEFDTAMRGYSNAHEMLEAVGRDSQGIGFGPWMDSPGAKRLRIANVDAASAVEATVDNLRNVRYPTSRRLYWALAPSMNADVRDLVAWGISSQGQLVAESVGYYPLNSADRQVAALALSGAATVPKTAKQAQ